MAFVYILKCSDGSYYVGSTTDLERRLVEHQTSFHEGYTSSRLPVELVWSADFASLHEAFVFERQVKGWSRAKKESLIRGDWNGIHEIVEQERKEREKKGRKKPFASALHPERNQVQSKGRPSTPPAKAAGSAQDAGQSARDDCGHDD